MPQCLRCLQEGQRRSEDECDHKVTLTTQEALEADEKEK